MAQRSSLDDWLDREDAAKKAEEVLGNTPAGSRHTWQYDASGPRLARLDLPFSRVNFVYDLAGGYVKPSPVNPRDDEGACGYPD